MNFPEFWLTGPEISIIMMEVQKIRVSISC